MSKRQPPGAEKPVDRPADPPDYLDRSAAAEWRRVSAVLAEGGMLSLVDTTALAAYCTTFSRWKDAEIKLREAGPVVKSPSGYPIQNPYLSIANQCLKQMRSYLVEFGMSPKSRKAVL